MKIDLFTPEGKIFIDSDTVTDNELAALNTNRAWLDRFVAYQSYDIRREFDKLKIEVEELKKKP